MNYEEALNFIHSTLKFGSKPGLERIDGLCRLLGNPQDKLKFVHIAGTNGKGSTSAMTASILTESGLKVGLYTSPYIVDFRERIRVDGEYIGKEDLARLTENVMNKAKTMSEHPTEFELITALAFEYFLEQKCDIVVLETGLGGRFDATNIIKTNEVSAICAISLDHTQVLGDTIEKIAFEKAGIIKEDAPVVLYPEICEGAEEVIRARAKKLQSPVIKADLGEIKNIVESPVKTEFEYKGYHYKTTLAGGFQAKNGALAIEIAYALKTLGYRITQENIQDGIAEAVIEGRLEVLSESPLVIIDGGHNPQAMDALCGYLDRQFKDKSITAIMGMSSDKDYAYCISEVAKRCDRFFAVASDNPRAMKPEEVYIQAKPYCKECYSVDCVERAMMLAVAKAPKDGVILGCGSLYMIGDIRKMYK